MAFDLKVNHYKRKKMRNGQMANVMDRHTPYLLFLTGKPQMEVFLREGQMYWRSGDRLSEKEVTDLPSDIKDTIKKLDAEGKKAYGVPKGV